MKRRMYVLSKSTSKSNWGNRSKRLSRQHLVHALEAILNQKLVTFLLEATFFFERFLVGARFFVFDAAGARLLGLRLLFVFFVFV